MVTTRISWNSLLGDGVASYLYNEVPHGDEGYQQNTFKIVK
jgi:hypothetical protein